MTYDEAAGVDCAEILGRVYEFVDNELVNADCRQIQAHLAECAPCLRAVDFERLVRAVVARSCCELAPVELRQRVMFSIRQVQVQQMQVGDWREPR
jgi:mycothiol system anti-sigma-R factor